MTMEETILGIIAEEALHPTAITDGTNLYTDLGYDSLAFTRLLVRIETAFSVTFNITEMQDCLQVDHLMNTVRNKLTARGRDHA